MIDGAFGVRVSEEGDTFLPFGAEEREPVEAGEVVYATGSHVRTGAGPGDREMRV